MVKAVELGDRRVGEGEPCFIIAEIGVNHNGDMQLAEQLIDAAASCGADAVKFQTFKADRLTTATAPKADYQKASGDPAESQFKMLERLELTPSAHLELMRYCQRRKVQFLSTPFDEESADTLIDLGVTCLKLPSGELTNLPFLRYVAAKHLPVILSTGMASLPEVENAVEIFREAGNTDVVLLHCVSNYPAAPEDCNLRAMQTMQSAFGLPVGFSDHTVGIEVALAAVARGACTIEKHLTLDQNLAGPDHKASAEPDVFAALVKGIRSVEAALGDGRKEPCAAERATAEVARRSIVAAVNIPPGSVITGDMLALRRPGTGLPPAMLPSVTGRAASRSIPAGGLISWDMLV